MITSTLRVLVIAAATTCASGAALAQTPPGFPADPERSLLERIDLLRREEGTTAEELIDPLRALALQYQESGDHALAVVALQEARQVMRVNYGLSSDSVDDALLLHQQIRSERALGHAERVWDLQQDLVGIARQHLDDRRMLPVFLDLIDDRTDVLAEFRNTNFVDLPAGLFVPCEPSRATGDTRDPRLAALDARACPFGSYRTVVAKLNFDILMHYAEAIEVLVKNGDFASPELRTLERQAMRLPFAGFNRCSGGTLDFFIKQDLVGGCLEPLVRGYFGGYIANVGGRASLLRLVYYEFRSGAPAADRANAIAELADWYVRAEHLNPRSKFSPADEVAAAGYKRALAELLSSNDGPASIARIFSPELPITLPVYEPNPLASVKSSRYIEVGFAITDHGSAEKIEILSRSASVARADEKQLVRLIESASFRPRAIDGELAASAPVVVRYYLPEGAGSDIVSAR